MPYRVELRSSAAVELRKLERNVQIRVARKLELLAENPRPSGVIKLVGADNLYRVRVGDYRILYSIDDAAQLITVEAIADRKDVYR